MSSGPARQRPRRLGDLGLLWRQLGYEQLNFWLNPVAALFTLGFSVVFLLLLGTTAGTSHSKVLGGQRLLQYYVPGFVAYGIMATCFTNLAVALVVRRETGLFKRMRLAPLPTWIFLAAVMASTAVVTAIQVVMVVLIGRFGYHVDLPHAWGAFVLAVAVGTASFSALGVAVSTLVPNQEAGGAVVNMVFFVLLFLSGLWFPLAPGSALATFSSLFPIRHLILAIYAPFDPANSSPWAFHDLLVTAVWGLAGAYVGLRRWRWAPRRADGARRPLALGSLVRRADG